MTGRLDTPVPRRMKALEKDHRGYPVPYVVLRDANNKPHFAVNDRDRVNRCLTERLCAICGSALSKLMWFTGGPASAFHPNGWYLDTALHHECMTYAMRVCPYMAAPSYPGRVDAGTLDPAALLPEHRILMDYTQDPSRPIVFVAVGAKKMEIGRQLPGGAVYIRPVRPYAAIEFWRSGKRISTEEGRSLVVRSYAE